jgi:signal transduction histidine kinase
MNEKALQERYRELQGYIGWADEDATRVASLASLVESSVSALIDDFYEEIERHEGTRRVITGGHAQIERLKETLRQWVRDLFAGVYDESYLKKRWRVGWRHVEIGLDQIYTNVALSRLRSGLVAAVQRNWDGDPRELNEAVRSLNKLLDLDLAIIEEAYQVESGERLQRTERLATLGQVAGGVAHELRNPLNVVKTSVYYLLNARNPTKEKTEEHLRRIERHVGIADGVITALSNFAKMPNPNLTPTPLEPLIRDTLDVNPVGAGIEVAIELPPGLREVLADGDQLRIVFGNLVRNARDAMPDGGRLEIRGRGHGEGIEVDVVDTGVGIPKEDLKRVMEPLYSTKARGLGLGLSIIRSILDRCSGAIRVDSEPGRGTTFTVTLPAAPGSDGGES